MKYRVVFAKSAKRDIEKLDTVTRQRIAKKLDYFRNQEDPLYQARQLVDTRLGTYRYRVGHYRIVFDVSGDTLEIISVKHRKDVYKS